MSWSLMFEASGMRHSDIHVTHAYYFEPFLPETASTNASARPIVLPKISVLTGMSRPQWAAHEATLVALRLGGLATFGHPALGRPRYYMPVYVHKKHPTEGSLLPALWLNHPRYMTACHFTHGTRVHIHFTHGTRGSSCHLKMTRFNNVYVYAVLSTPSSPQGDTARHCSSSIQSCMAMYVVRTVCTPTTDLAAPLITSAVQRMNFRPTR